MEFNVDLWMHLGGKNPEIIMIFTISTQNQGILL